MFINSLSALNQAESARVRRAERGAFCLGARIHVSRGCFRANQLALFGYFLYDADRFKPDPGIIEDYRGDITEILKYKA